MIYDKVSTNRSAAFEAGVNALQNAQMSTNAVAKSFAESAAGHQASNTLNNNVVTLKSAEIQAKASAEVISRSDSMLGSIIDIFV
ncbi:hypothetical protein [Glaciecola petra]|uniref:Flagellar biosynthesis protein FlgE n=1 Tax=Glaciecola petra TaxID=3075602 RepID=A0ABU2ZSB4_9ALTE|nr:hypothetical protein [Aestuariibacter sp. P117]MDT0595151.1 hypothetical protein [Aestuariibacter sp. P117]